MHESLSSSLGHYFARMVGPGPSTTFTTHITQGADCLSAADLVGLRVLLPQVMSKSAAIKDSARLRLRIEFLASYVAEVPPNLDTPLHREAVFVLYYLLHGRDLIPDSIPEIGLLDDALLIEAAFNRNQRELRSHWAEHGRSWPDNV